MLSETSQSEKDNNHMVALTGRIEEPAQRIIQGQENGEERHQRGRQTMRCLTIETSEGVWRGCEAASGKWGWVLRRELL